MGFGRIRHKRKVRMDIQDWKASLSLNDAYREVRALGLESQVAELDSYGFTVIPDALGPKQLSEVRDKLLAVNKERTGEDVDLSGGTTHLNRYQVLFGMLLEDPMFERVLMNPIALALVNYYLGQRSVLSSFNAVIRGPGGIAEDGAPLQLHHDTSFVPDPQPAYAQVFNVTWCLTDYSKENGSIRFVPGSHKLCRHPLPGEAEDLTTSVDAPAGSLIAFHGNTWHGNYVRTNPGVRMNLITYFTRMYIRPIENFIDLVPSEAYDRNPPRFASLMGTQIGYPYRSKVKGSENVRGVMAEPLSAMNQFA
jgi:ectoine hydroxylase-related dioxygenase (phytanoyl-CoA dioxygenase family)